MQKKTYFLLALFIIIKPSFASLPAPQCPHTPLRASVGDQLPGGWKLWKTDEIYSWWKGFKYRNFKETYQIDKWDDTLEGYFSISPKQTRYYIACCKHKKNRDFFLCAMKEMDMVQYCKAPMIPFDAPTFKCTPWDKYNQKVS